MSISQKGKISQLSEESKSDKFCRLAEYRTNKVIKYLRSLSKLSNKAAYEYLPGELDLIFEAINREMDDVMKSFNPLLKVESKFTLRNELEDKPHAY